MSGLPDLPNVPDLPSLPNSQIRTLGARLARTVGALGLLAAVCCVTSPARAQLFGWWGYQPFEISSPLAQGEIRRNLAQQGYRLVAPMQRNGRVLVADVTDGRGRALRLIVDRYDGRVVQRFINASSRGDDITTRPLRERQQASRDDNEDVTPATQPNKYVAPQKPRPTVQARPKRQTAATAPARTPPRAEPTDAATAAPREPSVAASPSAAVAPSVAAAPSPPVQTAKPASPAKSGPAKPGYVEGVPINPLD